MELRRRRRSRSGVRSPRQRWRGGFPTKREAGRALGRALAAVGAGEVPDAGRLTVGTYFDQWLAGHALIVAEMAEDELFASPDWVESVDERVYGDTKIVLMTAGLQG